MRKKLEGNGLWESSRMMLPEHKDRINIFNSTKDNRQRKYLDEQEQEQIGRQLRDSLKRCSIIRIRMFDSREQLRIEGVVDNINQQRSSFCVNGDWYPLADIEGVDHVVD